MHDEVGYDYRLPNRGVARRWRSWGTCFRLRPKWPGRRHAAFFEGTGVRFVQPIAGAAANGWLNAIVLDDEAQRGALLEYTNGQGPVSALTMAHGTACIRGWGCQALGYPERRK